MAKYIKMFIAGLALPSAILPCLLFFARLSGITQIFSVPFIHFIPIIWGIWNILYFKWFLKILPQNATWRLLMTGGILGFLVALIAIFGLHIPTALGLSQSLTYLPLIVAPILYALLWLYIVNPLNLLLNLHD